MKEEERKSDESSSNKDKATAKTSRQGRETESQLNSKVEEFDIKSEESRANKIESQLENNFKKKMVL